MHVIAVMNQKGGVGKTATTLNLLSSLKRRGYNVLGIDMDPQRGNLSQTLQADKTVQSMFEVLCRDAKLEDVIQQTELFDLAPATIDMADIDLQLNRNGGAGRESRLKEAIQSLDKGRYDFVVIDTPPALNLLTLNALTAAEYILVITVPDVNAMEGMLQLHEMVSSIQGSYNRDLRYIGILMNKYQGQTNISKEMRSVSDQLTESKLGARMFNTNIRSGVVIPSALSNHCDAIAQDPESGPAKDYEAFVDEFLDAIKKGAV